MADAPTGHKSVMEDIKAIPSWVWLGGAAVIGVLLVMGKLHGSSGSTVTQPAPSQTLPGDTSGGSSGGTSGTPNDSISAINNLTDAINGMTAAQGQAYTSLATSIAQEQQNSSLFQQQVQQNDQTFASALANMTQQEQQQFSAFNATNQSLQQQIASMQSQINSATKTAFDVPVSTGKQANSGTDISTNYVGPINSNVESDKTGTSTAPKTGPTNPPTAPLEGGSKSGDGSQYITVNPPASVTAGNNQTANGGGNHLSKAQ